MKKSYIFPGQGAQFVGMGKDLYDQYPQAKAMFEEANDILGFRITDVMFSGTDEDLRQTKVTQPAVFLHSVISAMVATDASSASASEGASTLREPQGSATGDNTVIASEAKQSGLLHCSAVRNDDETTATETAVAEALEATAQQPDMVAGHSLGEFSALVVAGALSFADGLRLVYARALAMQKACEAVPGTMAAILGLDDETVERICGEVSATDASSASASGDNTVIASEAKQSGLLHCSAVRNDDETTATETAVAEALEATGQYIVVPANYNSPGQLVISGTVKGVEIACEKLKEAGAKRALPLKVGGAFHSPLMQPAAEELQKAIEQTAFKTPICPIYQNVDAKPHTDPAVIKQNLILQLTAPVRWTGIVRNMLADARATLPSSASGSGGASTSSATETAVAEALEATEAIEFTEFGPGNVLMGLVGKIKN